jgi:amphi-Trp domain-containing protein
MKDHEEGRLKFKNVMQPAEAAVYFEAIVDGLRRGSLQLQHTGEKLVLEPVGDLKVEIKASRKDRKQKLSFEVNWKSPKPAGTITNDDDAADPNEPDDEP